MTDIKCTRCHVIRPTTGFTIKRTNEYYKRCNICRATEKAWSACLHTNHKSVCKICNDPIYITIRLWIMHSKQSDIKYNRYDRVNLIDTDFCKLLIEDFPACWYCNCELQYKLYQDDLATIERLNNNIGHIKANCIVCCRKCNYSKVGTRDDE